MKRLLNKFAFQGVPGRFAFRARTNYSGYPFTEKVSYRVDESKNQAPELISIGLLEDHRFRPKGWLESWSKDGFLERSCAKDTMKEIEKIVKDRSIPGLYLSGILGSGKSAVMQYCVSKARENGWLVVFIPRCDEWKNSIGSDSLKINVYCYYLDAILEGLKSKKISNSVKERFSQVFRPWFDSESWKSASSMMDYRDVNRLEGLCKHVNYLLEKEKEIPVLLAFDEVQELYMPPEKTLHGVHPFDIVNWGSSFEKGCVLVTGSSDSEFLSNVRSSYDSYSKRIYHLSDLEFKVWEKSPLYLNIQKLNYQGTRSEKKAELKMVTGLLPQELVLLNFKFALNHVKDFQDVVQCYSKDRIDDYKQTVLKYSSKNHNLMMAILQEIFKSFIHPDHRVETIDMEFQDCGILSKNEEENDFDPVNSNAFKVFMEFINDFEGQDLIFNELTQQASLFKSFDPNFHTSAFQKLFILELLRRVDSEFILRYKSCDKSIVEQSLHFKYLVPHLKDSVLKYPAGTLIAASKESFPKADYIYIGKGYVLIFDLPDFTNSFTDESKPLKICDRIDKLFHSSGTVICEESQQIKNPNYSGSIEYVFVSPKNEHEGSLHDLGDLCKFAKVLDREDLSKSKLFTSSQLSLIAKSIKLHALR